MTQAIPPNDEKNQGIVTVELLETVYAAARTAMGHLTQLVKRAKAATESPGECEPDALDARASLVNMCFVSLKECWKSISREDEVKVVAFVGRINANSGRAPIICGTHAYTTALEAAVTTRGMLIARWWLPNRWLRPPDPQQDIKDAVKLLEEEGLTLSVIAVIVATLDMELISAKVAATAEAARAELQARFDQLKLPVWKDQVLKIFEALKEFGHPAPTPGICSKAKITDNASTRAQLSTLVQVGILTNTSTEGYWFTEYGQGLADRLLK